MGNPSFPVGAFSFGPSCQLRGESQMLSIIIYTNEQVELEREIVVISDLYDGISRCGDSMFPIFRVTLLRESAF